MNRTDIRLLAQELEPLIKRIVKSVMMEIMRDDDDFTVEGNEEAAKLLGMGISTFNHLVKNIPHKKVGKTNYFREKDLYGIKLKRR